MTHIPEFRLIDKWLRPLTNGAAPALNLQDDTAYFEHCEHMVVTKDAIAQGTHFFDDTPLTHVIQRLIRSNISDILAMGATPNYYLLAACLPRTMEDDDLERLLEALEREQEEYGISLIGGDTVRHDGGLVLSATMFGEVKQGNVVKRSGAKVGDLVCVTGTLGDAALGMAVLDGQLPEVDNNIAGPLIQAYHSPKLPFGFQPMLALHANAAADISDGLVADLEHICTASNVGADVYVNELPVSPYVRAVLSHYPDYEDQILSGGDDYQLIFTISEEEFATLTSKVDRAKIMITPVGKITDSHSVRCLDEVGNVVELESGGYTHS